MEKQLHPLASHRLTHEVPQLCQESCYPGQLPVAIMLLFPKTACAL